MRFNKEEKRILLELICDKQIKMIIKNPDSYELDKYKVLESLKLKIKE